VGVTAPPVRVRRATAEDTAALADFARRLFHDTFAPDNRPEDMAAYEAETFSAERQAAELAEPGALVLLALVEGAWAGYAQLGAGAPPAGVPQPAVEVRRFYVDPAWHGRGVAPALMAAVREAALARDARALWLGVWERNARAIAFYARGGFVDVGAQPFRLGADLQTDRLMTLAL
jgi:GNAT superfamily N-acetyltransferase